MEGYIKLYRQIIDWQWYSDIPTCRLFIHLLLKVNHADHMWRGQEIKRGSCITSYASLNAETGLSVMQLRRAIKNLVSTGEIKQVTTNKNTLIIVTKYGDFQGLAGLDNKQTTSKEQTNNNQILNKEQSNNKQTTTNKNDKNDKNDKNIINTYSSPSEEPQIDYKLIVEILNIETGKTYSYKSNKTRKLIQARVNEGHSVEDFRKVIEKKVDEWSSDPYMAKYLRPSTLFGNKFDEYLNE